MREYIRNITKTNDLILNGTLGNGEIDRFSKADYRWADNKRKSFQTRKIKKGEIYQFEFGKNYMPEMSYEHRGLVIGVKNKLLYILPIYSYDAKKHTDVYHPVDFPYSKGDLYLLKSSEFSWINHDSVLKLNDIRTVSINRILYQHTGAKIDPATDTYKRIETFVVQKYFAEFYHDFEQMSKTIELLNQDNAKLKEKIAALEKEKCQPQTAIDSVKEPQDSVL